MIKVMSTQRAKALVKRVIPQVVPFFHKDGNTLSCVVKDPKSKSCAIIDSAAEIDMGSGSVTYDGAKAIISIEKSIA